MDNKSVDDFLATYTPEIASLARQLRSLILDVIPESIEQVDIPAKLIGYGYDRTYTGTVCGIAPQKTYVNLMFAKGTELPDPDGLLEGTGKKARHVKIRTAEDMNKPAVRTLLHAAAAATKQGMEKKKRKT
jgi:hypothetical protein